jgi:hypothetical protein
MCALPMLLPTSFAFTMTSDISKHTHGHTAKSSFLNFKFLTNEKASFPDYHNIEMYFLIKNILLTIASEENEGDIVY